MSFIIKLIFLILVYYVIHLVRSSNNSKVLHDELCSFNRSKKTNAKSNGVSEDLYQRYKEYHANHMYTKPSEGATVITRGKQELAIIYDHEVDGLYRVFNTDEMSNFIKNNRDEAFLQSIIVIDFRVYGALINTESFFLMGVNKLLSSHNNDARKHVNHAMQEWDDIIQRTAEVLVA